MDLASAFSMEGPLEKESPNLIKIYQNRYFAIRGKGQFLVWFKKKPIHPDQDPKGILRIETISDILSQKQGRYFSVVYLERTFNFRAQSVAVKQRWVKCLQTIVAHHQKLNKNKQKGADNLVQSWKWKNNKNQQISEQIRLENEEVILTDASSSIGKRSQQFLTAITKDKSLFELQKCLVYGFFLKKRLVYSSQRWFFLASGVNLKDQKDEQLYPKISEFLDCLKSQSAGQKKAPQQSISSSSESQSQVTKSQQKQKNNLRINTLFEYDSDSKQIKHAYNVIDMISFDIKTSEQPFQLRIVYEEALNYNDDDDEDDQQIKESQIVLTSGFLSQVRKFHMALRIVSEKYSMHKHREEKNANKSKRYPTKKWRFATQDHWRVADEKSQLNTLLNKKALKISTLSIHLQTITTHTKQSLKPSSSSTTTLTTSSQNPPAQQCQNDKKQEVLAIAYKYQQKEEQQKIYIQLDKVETLNKLNKKLGRNVKKIRDQLSTESIAKIMTRKDEEKKVNQDTYLIDKKIRETHSSIKLNFYEIMDREVIVEKKEEIKQLSFFDKFLNMFCTTPIFNDTNDNKK